MTTATQTSVTIVTSNDAPLSYLEESRNELFKVFADSEMKTGDIIRRYSGDMTLSFGAGWYDSENKDTKKGIKAERNLFKAGLEKLDFTESNIDKIWQRVKESSGKVYEGTAKVKADTQDVDDTHLKVMITMLNRTLSCGDDTKKVNFEKSINAKKLMFELFFELGGAMGDLKV